jgi:hypothetical protein
VNKEHIVHSDVHVIEPTKGLRLVDPFELWRWRELFVALMVRDIAARYKQTAIGIAWVVIQPLATVAIFSFLLGKLGNVPTGGLPYPLFAFAAMVPWQVFSRALMQGSMSLASDRSLVTKVYFPRILAAATPVPEASNALGFRVAQADLPCRWRHRYTRRSADTKNSQLMKVMINIH